MILLDKLRAENITVPRPWSSQILPQCLQIVWYNWKFCNIWESHHTTLELIFRTEDNIRFGIGRRPNRTIYLIMKDNEIHHNIFQLSTGQTSILNIVLSIFYRDFWYVWCTICEKN